MEADDIILGSGAIAASASSLSGFTQPAMCY